MKDELATCNAKMDDHDERITKIEESISNLSQRSNVDPSMQQKVKSLEDQLEKLYIRKTTVCVIGGLGSLGSEGVAKTWIAENLAKLGAPKAIEIFSKRDEFKDVLYVKFVSSDEIFLAETLLRSARLQACGINVWITTHSPIEEQIPRKFLFRLKKLLITDEWGYDSRRVYADVAILAQAILAQDGSGWLSRPRVACSDC